MGRAEGWLGNGYGPPGQGKPGLQNAAGAKSPLEMFPCHPRATDCPVAAPAPWAGDLPPQATSTSRNGATEMKHHGNGCCWFGVTPTQERLFSFPSKKAEMAQV